MGKGINFFSKLFKNQDEDFLNMELDEGDEEEFEWDWDHIMEDRHLFKMSDDVQREKYIRSLVEQIRDASDELDKLSGEYNLVTANLKDMDELEALPYDEKKEIQASANEIIKYEGIKRDYSFKVSNLTEEQYHTMEMYEKAIPKAIEDMHEAEEYRVLIKRDLVKLEGERQAYIYREQEFRRDMNNYKGMTFICIFAALLCMGLLLILQFGFEMKTGIGYIADICTFAVAITVLYVKYENSVKGLGQVQRGINKIILLQNTVKIRYVNNTNLLDYIYTKYRVESSAELKKIWDYYLVESEERRKQQNNEQDLTYQQNHLLKLLRRYQLSDVYAWLNNPLAIVDKREMVELRHAHIIQRQKLRARMDYNKRLAKEGEKELKEFVKQYPSYGEEALKMMERYSQ